MSMSNGSYFYDLNESSNDISLIKTMKNKYVVRSEPTSIKLLS